MKQINLSCGLAAIAVCATMLPTVAQETGDLERFRQHALALVNEARSAEGLSKLSLGPALNEAAQAHAADMVDRDYYAHVSPDGRTPSDRFRAAGGSRWGLSGENIAKCTNCAQPPDIARLEAFQTGWMQSPGHRKNILNDGFDRFGFGISSGGNEIYAVQTFAGPGGGSDGAALTDPQAGTIAGNAINSTRESAGFERVDASETLDKAADRLLEIRIGGGELPKNVFALLPEGSTGWTSLAILSASRGGSGAVLSKGTVEAVVESWAEERGDTAFGGRGVTHFGFAAAAQDDGRKTAVAILGTQD